MARVISLLRAYDPVLSIAAIDVGSHDPDQLGEFQRKQCVEITSGLTAEHHSSVREELWRLRNVCEGLHSKLFIQCFLTIILVKRVLEDAVMYYAQRKPDELGSFRWRIDAKQSGKVVDAEDFWIRFILPVLTSGKRPRFNLLREGDYRSFDHFSVRDDSEPGSSGKLDLQQLLGEDRAFVDSRECLGVQLADIMSSAVFRAFNGSLGSEGWGELGRLLILRDVQTVQLMQLNANKESGEKIIKIKSPHSGVVRLLESRAKPMLTPRTIELMNQASPAVAE